MKLTDIATNTLQAQCRIDTPLGPLTLAATARGLAAALFDAQKHHPGEMALPDDPLLFQELTAPQWTLSTAGIQIEDKDDIKQRIGRSPDRADTLVLTYWGIARGSSVLWGFA